jgi:hypothetical protein
MPTIKPRRVDFLTNAIDLRVLSLGALGFGNYCIGKLTGLTNGQINYRLRKGETKRSSYREGRSTSAQIVLTQAESAIAKAIAARLRSQHKLKKAS